MTLDSSTLKSTGRSEISETSDAKPEESKIRIFRTDSAFVAKYWPVVVTHFGEIIEAEENVKPTLARTNALLHGFLRGSLNFWVAASDRRLVAFFVTSKHVGGPCGSGQMYLSYLRGLESIPPAAWNDGIAAVKEHMAEEGCSMLIATTQSEKVKEMAQRLGATADHRLVWRI